MVKMEPLRHCYKGSLRKYSKQKWKITRMKENEPAVTSEMAKEKRPLKVQPEVL
jgi:hypothetical protein